MLKKLQAITGLIFATFVAVHLLNTWLAGLGPAAYDGVQVALRQVYQFIFVEVLILSALLVHVRGRGHAPSQGTETHLDHPCQGAQVRGLFSDAGYPGAHPGGTRLIDVL